MSTPPAASYSTGNECREFWNEGGISLPGNVWPATSRTASVVGSCRKTKNVYLSSSLCIANKEIDNKAFFHIMWDMGLYMHIAHAKGFCQRLVITNFGSPDRASATNVQIIHTI